MPNWCLRRLFWIFAEKKLIEFFDKALMLDIGISTVRFRVPGSKFIDDNRWTPLTIWIEIRHFRPNPLIGDSHMSFFRQQEEKLAMRFLSWQYQKLNASIPDDAELARQAAQIVEEAHKIARERGRNVVAIMKDLIADLKKR